MEPSKSNLMKGELNEVKGVHRAGVTVHGERIGGHSSA